MRNVVNGSMVGHRWAHGQAARTGTDNFRTDGVTVWSYATPIASRIVTATGETAFLVSAEKYSSTTAKHLSHVRRATFGPYVFLVACVTCTERAGRGVSASTPAEMHALNVADLVMRARDAWGDAVRATRRARSDADQARRLADLAVGYVTTFALDDVVLTAALDWNGVTLAQWAAYRDATCWPADFVAHVGACDARAAIVRPYRPRSYSYVPRPMLTPAEWRAGTGTTCDAPSVMLRARGASVETSLGASVPMTQARTLYAAWVHGLSVIGATIGAFTVLAQTPEVLTIGCHRLTRAECDAFASAQGWTSAMVAA